MLLKSSTGSEESRHLLLLSLLLLRSPSLMFFTVDSVKMLKHSTLSGRERVPVDVFFFLNQSKGWSWKEVVSRTYLSDLQENFTDPCRVSLARMVTKGNI